MGQPVAFVEVASPDRERAQTFYAALFDWTVDADPATGGYGLVGTGAGEGAIGGDFGRFATLADPDGNPVGPWA